MKMNANSMNTCVALTQGRDHDGLPLTMAAYAVPLHTFEEGQREGPKLWQLLVREVSPYCRAIYAFQFSSTHGYLISFSSGGRYLAAALGGEKLVIWDTETGLVLPELLISGLEEYVFVPGELARSGQPLLLIAGQEGLTVAVFSEGVWGLTLKPSSVPLRHLAFNQRRGYVALLLENQSVPMLWSIDTLLSSSTHRLDQRESSDPGPELVYSAVTHYPLRGFSFTPSGSHLLMLHGAGELMLRPTTGQGLIVPLAHPDRPELLGDRESRKFPSMPMAFSADGCRLVVRGGYGLFLWERDTPYAPFQLPRYIHDGGTMSSEHDALGFTQNGDLSSLSILGLYTIYDWKSGICLSRKYLGFTEEIAHDGCELEE